MTVLSRMAKLAIAAEDQAALYVPPQFAVTFTKPATYRPVITPLRDTGQYGSDSELQGLEQGPWYTQWVIPSDGYPDLAGWWLRGIIGPDDCTPGVVTQLAAPVPAGAQAVALDAGPAAGTVLMIGAGDTLEYARIGTPSGPGPFTCPVESGGLLYQHAAGEPVASQAVHVFGQEMAAGFPTWSLSTSDGTGPLGWPGCVVTGLTVQIRPGGYVTMRASLSGYPAAACDDFTVPATAAQPMAGWEWLITAGGAPSTRGQAMKLSLTRKTDVMPAVMGQQGPAGIWAAGPLAVAGEYQAIYEDQSDMALYTSYLQDPAVHSLAQPDLLGGCSLTLTLPSAGTWAGEADQSGDYLAAKFSLSGIASPLAGPSVGVTLVNYWQQAY